MRDPRVAQGEGIMDTATLSTAARRGPEQKGGPDIVASYVEQGRQCRPESMEPSEPLES
jgi:hypothetical protein